MCEYIVTFTPPDDMSAPELERTFTSFKEARGFASMIIEDGGFAELIVDDIDVMEM